MNSKRCRGSQQFYRDIDNTRNAHLLLARREPVIDVAGIVRGLFADSHDEIVRSCSVMLTTMLLNPTTPFDRFIEQNAVPRLVELLHFKDFPKIQKQSALILGCIAGGTDKHKMTVLASGACPALLMLLDSDDSKVARLAGFALESIISGAPHIVNMIMRLASSLAPCIINGKLSTSFLRLACSFVDAWGTPTANPSILPDAIQAHLPEIKLLLKHRFEGFALLACGLLDCALEGSPEQRAAVQQTVDSDVFTRLVQIIATSYNYNLLTLAVRLVRKICQHYPHTLIEFEVLPALKRVVEFDTLVSYEEVQIHNRTLTLLVHAVLHDGPEYIWDAAKEVALLPLFGRVDIGKTIHKSTARIPAPSKPIDRIIAICAEADILHLLLDASLRGNDYASVLDVLKFLKTFLHASTAFRVSDSFWKAFEEMELADRLKLMLRLDHEEIREMAFEFMYEYERVSRRTKLKRSNACHQS